MKDQIQEARKGRRKSAFSVEEHQANGNVLKDAHDFLSRLYVEIANQYGGESAVAERAEDALRHLDALRCELDSQVFKDHPGLDESAAMNCYYGTRG